MRKEIEKADGCGRFELNNHRNCISKIVLAGLRLFSDI
jgi:hypothetical protein